MTNPYIRCICCLDPMIGIMSVIVREVCEPCGGVSKLAAAHDQWLADLRAGRDWRKEA